jgi:hypothetical protein
MVATKVKDLLRAIVFAQDRGVPVFEILEKAKYELTFIDRLMVAAHTERLRMKHEGFDVLVPSNDPESSFILGLENFPYKKECEHEWYLASIVPLTNNENQVCPKCGMTRTVEK